MQGSNSTLAYACTCMLLLLQCGVVSTPFSALQPPHTPVYRITCLKNMQNEQRGGIPPRPSAHVAIEDGAG